MIKEEVLHPWYVEEACEECGWKDYFFKRTEDGAATLEWYERGVGCSECGGKRVSCIGNVLTDNPPNKDLMKLSGKKNE